MKRYAKAPNTIVHPAGQPSETPPPYSEELVDFDIERMLAQGGEILRREIRNLMSASAKGKLDAAGARDLVAYLKLLSELKAQQQAEFADMDEEELKKFSK